MIDSPLLWLVLIFVVEVVCGAFGASIAGDKRRSVLEGFLLGFLFGPIGVLITVFSPSRQTLSDSRRRSSWADLVDYKQKSTRRRHRES